MRGTPTASSARCRAAKAPCWSSRCWTARPGGALTERTVRETQARIEQALRFDYETFINASFFLQGKADQFTQQNASRRKEVLGSILGLEVWEVYKARTADAPQGDRAGGRGDRGPFGRDRRRALGGGAPQGQIEGVGENAQAVAARRARSPGIRAGDHAQAGGNGEGTAQIGGYAGAEPGALQSSAERLWSSGWRENRTSATPTPDLTGPRTGDPVRLPGLAGGARGIGAAGPGRGQLPRVR